MNTQEHKETKLVIVGNGMATNRLLDEILKRKGKAYTITIIGDESYSSYNRIMLSAVLAKDFDENQIVYHDDLWFKKNHITLVTQTKIEQIHREDKYVQSTSGNKYYYDQLILATGSRPAIIGAANQHLDNIFSFRTLADTHRIIHAAEGASAALVIGGGLLGLEAAYGLAKFGVKVTLVHRSAWPLNRQLDQDAGVMLKKSMEKMGIEFRLSSEVARFHGIDKVAAAELKNGEKIVADLVVIATGITPNAELGSTCELAGERAILVDDFMQTSDACISALGECVEHKGKTFGLVDPIWRQAESLAARLVEAKMLRFTNQSIATKLKVSGVQVFSAGKISPEAEERSLTVSDPQENIYRKLIFKDNRITGIVLFGDVSSGPFYFEKMQSNDDMSKYLPNILFGETFCNVDSEIKHTA